MRRRASLHLTYYAYGDTRKRGMALLRFKHAYRQAGIQLGDSELPDYLPLVLEFAATIDQQQGERLLAEHVPVLELLAICRLQDSGSAYANILAAILATLPPISTAGPAPHRRAGRTGPARRRGRTGAVRDGSAHVRRTSMNTLLWMTVPYVAFTSFALGHVWRYRTDQFGWTTRSSQIYESRLLRMGSPLFHFGLLGVFGGHVVGLLIPQSWTSAVGVSEHAYHLMAVTMGSLAGFAVIAGLAILLYRRITVAAVRTVDERAATS